MKIQALMSTWGACIGLPEAKFFFLNVLCVCVGGGIF